MWNWIKASYTGRIGRKHFAMLFVLLIVLRLVILPLVAVLSVFGPLLGTLLTLAVVIFFNLLTLHIYARRLHDVGLTGWLIMLSFIPGVGPYVGLVISLALLCWPGNKDTNTYGQPPPNDRTLRDVLWNP